MTIKKLATKVFTIAACAAMIATVAPTANVQSVQSATTSQGTVNLTTKKLVIPKGKSTAITNNTLEMIKGRRYQIKAKFGSTFVKSQGTWKSTKPAVVTVSKTGLIQAKAPGTATVKVTYNGKTQSVKIKVIASHTHSWKTISKATCATKGKKLCKTCGATGSTAMSTTHDFKVTKKATCATKGKQTCTVCGTTEAIAKTKHEYETSVWTTNEGRGKAYTVDEIRCNGCDIDMTDWTHDERNAHQSDIDGVLAGTSSFDCFSAGIHGTAGVTRYPKYMKVEITDTFCKYCGIRKGEQIRKDLYELKPDPYGVLVRVDDTSSSATTASNKTAASNAVVAPQDVIEVPETPDVEDLDVPTSENTVSDNIVITDTVVSDNAETTENIADTENNGGGDIVSEDLDDTADDDNGDDTDDGTDDYDGSEGEVVEDE